MKNGGSKIGIIGSGIVGQGADVANLNGKTVIDTTNPIPDAPPVNGVLQYFISQNESLMERLQALAPEGSLREVVQLHWQRVHG